MKHRNGRANGLAVLRQCHYTDARIGKGGMRMKKITVRIQDETAEYLVSMPGYAISRAGETALDCGGRLDDRG